MNFLINQYFSGVLSVPVAKSQNVEDITLKNEPNISKRQTNVQNGDFTQQQQVKYIKYSKPNILRDICFFDFPVDPA